MNKRILEVIEKYEGCDSGNISKFSRKIGELLNKDVKPSQISEWVSGKTKPGADYRRAICEAYGRNRDWLDTGNGEMLRDSLLVAKSPSPTHEPHAGPALSYR